MSVGLKVARVEVCFLWELPANAIIGLTAVCALSLSMFPTDEHKPDKALITASKGLVR